MAEKLFQDGIHKLSGVCRSVVITGMFEESHEEAVVLTIDGQDYIAHPDPDDGYRSYATIYATDKPIQRFFFPEQDVMIKNYHVDAVVDDYFYDRKDWLEILNPETNELILSVGTDYSDSYYPMAIFKYNPENLPLNAKR